MAVLKLWVTTMGMESGDCTPTSRSTPPVRSSNWPRAACCASVKAGSAADGRSSSARPRCWLRAMNAASLRRCTMLTTPGPELCLAIISDSAIGSSQITAWPSSAPALSCSSQVVCTDQRPLAVLSTGAPICRPDGVGGGSPGLTEGWTVLPGQPPGSLVHSSRPRR